MAGVGGTFPVKSAELFIGNAGTAVRPLTAALAFSGGRYRLSGVPRMHERPIRDLVDALRGLGADIAYLGKDGFPPLEIRPGAIRSPVAARVRGDVSSQYVTALLMALPLVGGGTIAIDGDLVSKPYVEMTLNLMARFGVPATRTDWSSFTVPAASYRSPREIHVEGDASSASYFLAAGAISGTRTGGAVRVEGVGRSSIQGDVRFTEVLERMGATVRLGESWIEVGARAGSTLTALDADLNHIPDAAMTAAMLALFADGTSVLRNIGNWRVKETDRLAAMATELRKLGATVEEGTDHLRVTPPDRLPGGHHRHLRRPPHGHVLLARRARRRLRAHQRPRLRAQDLSRVLQRVPSDGGGRALSAGPPRRPNPPAAARLPHPRSM